MKKIELELPTVLGVGISGPVLAFLSATLFAAFRGVFGWDAGIYAVIMFGLSAILAAFPVWNSNYPMLLRVLAWPLATVMIFASAWGSSTGLSAGSEVLGDISMGSKATALMDDGFKFDGRMETPASGPMEPMNTDADTVNPRLTNEDMWVTTETDPVFTNWVDDTNIAYQIADEWDRSSDSVLQGGFFKRLR